MSYRFIHATDEETLAKIYRFRYKIMCEELHIITHNDLHQEKDRFDRFSEHFAVLDEEGAICATVRLIHHSSIGYPTEHYLEFDRETHRYDTEAVAEISRIFVDKSHRNLRDTKLFLTGFISHFIYPKLKEYGIRYCYGSLEKAFLKLVNMARIPYKAIGEKKEYNGACRYPAILSTDELEACNPQLITQQSHPHRNSSNVPV